MYKTASFLLFSQLMTAAVSLRVSSCYFLYLVLCAKCNMKYMEIRVYLSLIVYESLNLKHLSFLYAVQF